MTLPGEQIQYDRYRPDSGWETAAVSITAEANISLSVNGEMWLSFACTPTDLEAMAVGFLYNEGIIHQKSEIATVDLCHEGTNIDIWLHHSVEKPINWRRTSGCTGGFTTAGPDEILPQAAAGEPINPDVLLACMNQLMQAQALYHETGGIHCSAIFDKHRLHLRAEDIGRHNTLDKLAGMLLLTETQVEPMIIATTGRISAEMMQKTARMGAVVVMSRTSPTSQSVMLAQRSGITLIGYARNSGFTVYAHPERLK